MYWFICLYSFPSRDTDEVVTDAVCFADLWDDVELVLDIISIDSRRDEAVDELLVELMCRSSLLIVSALNTTFASFEFVFSGLTCPGAFS
jgi:hypothetical protein